MARVRSHLLDTPSLLTLLDFFYAVTFGYFLEAIFATIVVSPLTEQKAQTLALSGTVFFYILLDWLDARELTLAVKYNGYFRFFLDLVTAFLSFGALWQAAHGRGTTPLSLGLVALAGSFWAMVALWETNRAKPPQEDHRQYLQLVRFTHMVGAVGLILFWGAVVWGKPGPWLTWWSLGTFVLFVMLFLGIEELLCQRVDTEIVGPRIPGEFIRSLFRGFISPSRRD